MLTRPKNWIIKKLGGYTKAEYDNLSRFPIRHFEFMPPQRSNIVTLQTQGAFDKFNEPSQEWLENRVVCELAKQLKPYVTWEYEEDCCRTNKIVRAAVKVVE